MQIKELAEKTRFYKQTPEGVSYMCKAIEKLRDDAVMERNIQVAISLLTIGKLSFEDIASVSKLPVERVREISEEMKSTSA